MKKLILLFILLISTNLVCLAKAEIFQTDESSVYHHFGVKNENNKIIIPPKYFSIYENDTNGYFIAVPEKQYSVYTISGVPLLDIKNASVEYYDNDFAIVKDDKGCYLADNTGKKLSEYYYDMKIEPLYLKIILGTQNKTEEYGVISKKGKLLVKAVNMHGENIKNKYLYGVPVKDGGFIAVKLLNSSNDRKEFFYFDKNENITKLTEDEAEKYLTAYGNGTGTGNRYRSNWRIFENGNYKYGISDIDGRKIIDYKYEETNISLYEDKFFAYKENNLWGIKTIPDDKTVLKPTFKNEITVKNGFIFVNKSPSFIVFDNNGNKIFELYNTNIETKFYEGYAVISQNVKGKILYGYINEKGENVIKCQYDYAHSFKNGKADVEKDGKKFYIDKSGNDLI